MKIAILRNITLVLLLTMASLLHGAANAGEVEFVVGDLMAAEGGTWDSKSSPLTSPFGVDFDSGGDMWIVELEGGRVHKLDSA